MSTRARATERRTSHAPISGAATIVAVEDDGSRVIVRAGASLNDARTRPLPARLAQIAGYRATEGDRVVVAGDEGDLYVVAVIHAAEPPALALGDGATAQVRDGALEVRDPEGRLLVRYRDGAAEITAPSRDLRLVAPNGRVVIDAGMDVAIEAQRDVTHRAGRKLDLTAGASDTPPAVRIEPKGVNVKTPRLAAEIREGRLAAGKLQVFARSIASTAERVAHNVARYDLTAGEIVEKAKTTLREVAELAEARLGRSRTTVSDTFTLHARRSTLVSEEETTVDGSKILLG